MPAIPVNALSFAAWPSDDTLIKGVAKNALMAVDPISEQ